MIERIPPKIEDMIDLNLSMRFIGNIMSMCQWIDSIDELEEYITYDASTEGFYHCLMDACDITDKSEIMDYLGSLNWHWRKSKRNCGALYERH